MGIYLNSSIPFKEYKRIVRDKYFVDKTKILTEIIPVIGLKERYLCFTRPRRFGKSVMANMVGAFFEKDYDSHGIFNRLAIAKDKQYEEYINKYNIIYVDFSRTPNDCENYKAYIDRVHQGIIRDITEAYNNEVQCTKNSNLWDILLEVNLRTDNSFIFVLDEWDAPFHMDFITEKDQKKYLLFLKNLLKDQPYVDLVYMTGVLPIAKYSSGSELNMFTEYNMMTSKKFSEYFGFVDKEVDCLFDVYSNSAENSEVTREGLRQWYNGYFTKKGTRMYNPRSVSLALSNDQLASYWTSSGPYDEIFYYIKNNIEDVRDDLVMMISGEGVEAEVQDYTAASMNLDSKDNVYSAMVVYGLLTYHDGKVYIPNHELMEQYKRLLMTKESLGYVYSLANESKKMLKATLAGNTKTMAEILEYAHNTESPIFAYNSEIELAAVVNLVYLAARDAYRIEREDKAGKGYVDFIFYPKRKTAPALILELKVDKSPEDAIQQIKDKNYALRLKGKLGEKPKYTGTILLVGINYDSKTKKHECKIEYSEG